MIKLADILREGDITPSDIERILKRTGAEQDLYEPDWDEFTPEVCNTGLCDVFAEKFREEYPGAQLWGTSWGIGFVMGHVWVKYKGRYYDAETPNGVDNWKDIPYIQRVYSKYGKYPNDVERLSEGIDDPVKPGILKKRLGKLSCSRVRSAKAELENKGTHYAKALQRYLNYHCQ